MFFSSVLMSKNPYSNYYDSEQAFPGDEFDELVRIYRFSDKFEEKNRWDLFGIRASKRMEELSEVYALPTNELILVTSAAVILDKIPSLESSGQKVLTNSYNHLKEKFILSRKLKGLDEKIKEL